MFEISWHNDYKSFFCSCEFQSVKRDDLLMNNLRLNSTNVNIYCTSFTGVCIYSHAKNHQNVAVTITWDILRTISYRTRFHANMWENPFAFAWKQYRKKTFWKIGVFLFLKNSEFCSSQVHKQRRYNNYEFRFSKIIITNSCYLRIRINAILKCISMNCWKQGCLWTLHPI